MKSLERYYEKVYKDTDKLLKKLFGLNVTSAMAEMYNIKKQIEKIIGKDIEFLTTEDLIKYKLSFQYCKYKTLNNVLTVISDVAYINSFCKDDIKGIKNEN